jgi:O-antigen/teichoic acid export membrane protein
MRREAREQTAKGRDERPPFAPQSTQAPQPEVPQDLTRVVVRGVGVSGAGYIATQALTIAVYLVLAHLLSPAEFGTFAAGSIVAGVGMLFAQSGMLSALIQRRDRVEEAADTALVATLVAGLLLGLVGLGLAPLVGRFFGSHEAMLVAAAMSGCVLVRQVAVVPDALLQRRFSFARRLVAEPLSIVAFGVTAIVAAQQGLGVWALVLGTYAALTTHAVTAWAVIRWTPHPRRASFALWRELAAYGKHITGAEFLRWITVDSGALFVGRVLGLAPLGQYRLGYRIAARPFAALVNSVTFVLFPAFARIADDEQRFQAALLRSLRWLSVIALPMSAIVLPLGEPVVVLLFGERWRQAGLVLTATCAYTAGWALVSLVEHVAKVADRPDVVLRIYAFAGIAVVALTAALVRVDLVAVGVALSLSALAAAAYSFSWLVRITGIRSRVFLREIWPATVSATAMAGVLLALDRLVLDAGSRSLVEGLALVSLELVLGAVIYVAGMCVLAPATAGELISRLAPASSGSARVELEAR